MKPIGLILSPGRCGTVSIRDFLAGLGGPSVRVYHERMSVAETRPREYFRAYTPEIRKAQAGIPAVRALLDELDRDDDRTYIETGWTAYPLAPLLIERYRRRIRVVHLVRHPILAAASHAVKGLYEEGREEELGVAPAELLPTSPRVFHPELAEHWAKMSLLERNLFRVVEINLFILELRERYPNLPWLELRTEHYGSGTPARLADFFGLDGSAAESLLPRSNVTARLARGARSIGDEWRRAGALPWAAETTNRLGYGTGEQELSRLEQKMRRYRRSGLVEHFANLVYRIGPLRRLWRRPRMR
jgi:hypothetical protein